MIEKPVFSSANELREYIYLEADNLPKYNPMNAIGVSKFVGGLWVKKMAQNGAMNFDFVWFSPGLTSGSAGLKKLAPHKRIVFGMMFKMMNFLGKSQTPENGGKKYADSLLGKVGKNGELIGAPAGKTLGTYTEQTPLNPLMADPELQNELSRILDEAEV